MAAYADARDLLLFLNKYLDHEDKEASHQFGCYPSRLGDMAN